jgi:hypothetical protein
MTRIRSVIGTVLSLLLAATGFCVFAGSVTAAQSSNYQLQETGPGNAAGITYGSANYRMQGDLGWRQEAPLRSDSFTITNAPPALSSAASSASSVSSVAPDNGESQGGHRGGGTTTTPPASRPASSARPSSSAPANSSASSSASSDSGQSSSIESAGSSSADASHGAAEENPHSAPFPPAHSPSPCANTVLCPDPFWHPIDLSPGVDGSDVSGVPSQALPRIPQGERTSIVLLLITFFLGAFSAPLLRSMFRSIKDDTVAKRVFWYVVFAALGALLFALLLIQTAHAAVSSPQRHVYNGHLLDAAGAPITTPHAIRFSEWYDRDMRATDVVAGVIDTSSPSYAGYQEVFTVTPDGQGYFSVVLGTGAALPDLSTMDAIDLDNLFLQVEVKAAADPVSSYEMLDVNPSDPLIDRSPVLSVPFAQNADLLDQRDIGTGSGSIPLLASGGLLPVSTVPGGTNQDTFVVDADDDAVDAVALQFGTSLAETLRYDIADDVFVFSSDLKVEGDLVVTGLINGIDISNIAGSDDGKLRASSGGGLTINVTGGAYRINGEVTDYTGDSGVAVQPNATNQVFIGSGGLTVRTSGFPTDESFIRIAEVVTNGSGVTQINDDRVVLSDDREHPTEVNMHAEFQNASYQADAVDNVGQLSVSLDNITQRNFYLWSSTRTTLQDYDVVVPVTLPADFVRWDSSPIGVSYRTTSADANDSKIDISVFDTNGSPVPLGGGATGLASTSWATASPTLDPAATWTPGSEFLLRFKLSAKNAFQAHLGSVKLRYVRLTPQ